MNTLGMRVNLKTGALSQYAGLNYNSIASVLGTLVGVNEVGFYTMLGDNTVSFFETRHSDLKSARSKRIRTVIISGVFKGSLDITTVLDQVETETVRVYSEDTLKIKNYVIKFSSGYQGMFVGIRVANVDGMDFSVRQMAVVFTTTDSKWSTALVLGRVKTAVPLPTLVATMS
jgi:hypothetical protein